LRYLALGRLFMLKARMGTSVVLMLVVLFAFIFALSLLILFLLNEIPALTPSLNLEALIPSEIEIDEWTALYLWAQSEILTWQLQAYFLLQLWLPSLDYLRMILYVSVFTAVFVLFQWAIGPGIVRRSLHLQYLNKGENPWLEKTVGELAEKSGVPKPKIAIWSTEHPNACVFGRTAGSSTLAVSQGLLNLLNKEEISTVIGHEIGHLRHKDHLVMTFLSAIPVMCYMIAMFAFYGSRGQRRGKWAVILLVIAVVAFIVYIITLAVVRTLSRQREFYSDAYSAYLTENPRGMRSALTKIAYGLSINPRETHGARAFFIEDPANAIDQVRRIVEKKSVYDLDKDGTLDEKELELAMEAEAKKTKWNGLNNLFSTHPPTFRRVLLLSQIEKEMSKAKYSTKNIYKNI